MSSIWTPGGERPVPPRESGAPPPPPPPGPGRGPDDLDEPAGEETGEEIDEETAARLQELTEQLARTPASIVVANHVMGLFELAALHLSQRPPNLSQAQLAIDAMAAIVEGLGSRLEQSEATLKEALAQIRLAYVQLQEASANQ